MSLKNINYRYLHCLLQPAVLLPDFPSSSVILLSRLLEAGSTTVLGFPETKNLRLLQEHLKCSGVLRTSPTEVGKRRKRGTWITVSINVKKLRVQVLVLYTSIL